MAKERLIYTFGQTPDEEIIARLPHKYPMELNKSDMMHLLATLKGDHSGFPNILEWQMSFRTSILETLNIEEV